MSVKVTIQNGSFQKPDGTLLANGTLVLRLSQDATVSATAQVVSKAPITITLDASGQAPATAVWGNDTLSPSGTVYYVDVFDSVGKPVANTQSWSITGAGPIELTTMVRTDPGPTFPTPVLKAPAGDQTVVTNDFLPAPGNTTQSLGSSSAPWKLSSKAVSIVGASSPITVAQNTDVDVAGFLNIDTGLVTHSTIQINNGALYLGKDGAGTKSAGIVFHDGNCQIVVQPGPRSKESTITAASITSNVLTITGVQREAFVNGDVVWLSGMAEPFLNGQIVTVSTSNGTTQFTAPFVHANFSNASETGEAETGFILANSVFTLPDAAQGTAVDASGLLLGTSGIPTGGNGLFYGGSGIMEDSGIGLNTHIVFPVNTRQIEWTNSTHVVALTSAAASANRTATLPDASGTVGLVNTGTWTPTAISITTSGTVTYAGVYTQIDRKVFFTITITLGTGATAATTANVSALSLPSAPARQGTATGITDTVTKSGVGLVDTSSKFFLPTLSLAKSTENVYVITGNYDLT